jgi:hypothetical protein
MNLLQISSQYHAPMRVALALQMLATLFLLTILDGGTLAKVGGAAVIGFWVGAGIVVLRRPASPTRADLLYLRWGFPGLLVIAICASPLI